MIKILDKHVADKIAAGEVIDRPVSIIKELIENSLDANASSITVEIKNGGKTYIRVTDNGIGIDSDEAVLAFSRHATSKINSEEDLDSIKTLGFRGEALASICAVARVELVTKTSESKTGRKIVIEGSNVIENSAIGCPEGTTITVKDLFYNVPARKKFLATDNSETRRIIDLVSRIALSYGDVKFNLINGGKKVFATRGTGVILNNIINIFGTEMGRDLIPVEDSRDGFILKGFVSSLSASAPSRNKQIFAVNGRVISSKVMENALDEAYKEKLFHGRFPIAFLFLAMPPEKLDVNVHPTKKEVRFDNEYEVFDFISTAVKDALTVKTAIPEIRHEKIKTEHVLRFEKTDPGVQYSFEEININHNKAKIEESRDEVDIRNVLSTLRGSKEDSQILSLTEPDRQPFDFNKIIPLSVLFNTYIVAVDDNSFYLIDQHAAHERVFYEKLLNQYNSQEKNRQMLLIPLNFNVSAQAVATEEMWIEYIASMGYDIEFFGNNTYLVREIPAFMELSEAEAFLSDMFKELEDKPDLKNRKILEKIISKACKSAVKGGDHLKLDEIEALLNEMKSCINPFSCPHGRPTFIRMTKYEIEKLFKRV